MSQAEAQFTYQELNLIAVIIKVDMRVAETLGNEIEDDDKKLLAKVQSLIDNFFNLENLPQGEKS